MAPGPVTVVGGTGFLGRRIVRHLLNHQHSVRIASRHPDRSQQLFGSEFHKVAHVKADIDDEHSLAAALADSWAVVNSTSLYVEGSGRTFHSVHVEAAARLAHEARKAGASRLLHVSGIGSSPRSSSKYIRSRGQGEIAVRQQFPTATILRPAVMFGPDDGFLVPLTILLRRLPIFAEFGRGRTKLQPAYVEDVAEAIARVLETSRSDQIYEFGGPSVLSYDELLRKIRTHVGSATLLVPVPFAIWLALASAAEWLPHPPITRNQIELMCDNNVAWDGPGFASLGIEPSSVDVVLPEIF